jgi:hypothetical protein
MLSRFRIFTDVIADMIGNDFSFLLGKSNRLIRSFLISS